MALSNGETPLPGPTPPMGCDIPRSQSFGAVETDPAYQEDPMPEVTSKERPDGQA